MSNIINLTWDGATDNIQISGYQLQWRIATASAWSSPIVVNHDPNYGTNTIKSGGGSYSHVITQLADHYFRIRTIDNLGQFSGYKEILAPVDTNIILISATGSYNSNTVCIDHTMNPINSIILTQSSIVVNSTFVKNNDNSIFNGGNKYWRILLSGVSYNCIIDNVGKIVGLDTCVVNIKSEFLSTNSFSSNSTSSIICDQSLDESIYYSGSLIAKSLNTTGTIIYTTLESDGSLSSPISGGNRYYLITENSTNTYVVKISSIGEILSKQDYIVVCPTPTTSCCFVKGTKISMFDNTIINIEDIKIGDIVLTYNEETNLQEPGKVLNIVTPLRSDIIRYELSNSTIIESTSCHPYWIIDKGWSSFNPELTEKMYNFTVFKIEINDILLSIDNKEVTIDNINELITKKVTTYNLEIFGNHTYYANGILVHNKSLSLAPTQYEADGVTETTAWLNWQNSHQLSCFSTP